MELDASLYVKPPKKPTMISKKHKRRIIINERIFLWWVAEDDDSPFVPFSLAAHVVSEDGKFFVRYHRRQPDEFRHVTVLGEEFAVAGCGGRWRRFRCPRFGTEAAITPRDVRALIEWSLDAGNSPPEVDYKGQVQPAAS
jgi:hypothetical protein